MTYLIWIPASVIVIIKHKFFAILLNISIKHRTNCNFYITIDDRHHFMIQISANDAQAHSTTNKHRPKILT